MYREPNFSKPSLANAPECRFEPAPADTVLPDGFMSTTNYPTYVKVGGKWRMPERPRMDSHLVWDPATERLMVKEFRLIRKGDLVAVATAEDGSEGVLVWDRGFLDEVDDTQIPEAFAFMSSEVSREKPVNYDAIFREFVANRGANGFILWVIGPALVHARGRIAMEWLIHNGYCHGVITGNAVGVHDVEAALYGTTLGMMADGSGTAGGHATHMRAINEVKKAGSIAALVESGRLEGGHHARPDGHRDPLRARRLDPRRRPAAGDDPLGPRLPGRHARADREGHHGGDGRHRPPRHRRRQHAADLLRPPGRLDRRRSPPSASTRPSSWSASSRTAAPTRPSGWSPTRRTSCGWCSWS